MANTLRIKRSVSTNTPTTLAQGELAYSEDGSPNGQSELFIGTAGATITKIATDLLTGTDGVAAQPNASAQDNQTITSGLGIDGADAGDAGNITLTLATTELTDVLPVTADQFVFNDNSDELPKKYPASTIPLSIFSNDLSWTTDLQKIHGDYAFSTTTAAADPGAGILRYDNVTPASVTNLYIDDLEDNTSDYGWVLSNLAVGDIITIKSHTDAADYLVAQVSTAPTDNTGWWTVPVTVLSSGTLPTNTNLLQLDVDWISGSVNQTITSGLGIDGADAGDDGNITLTLATTELTDVLPVAADQFVFNDNTDETPKKYAASTIPLSIFDNDTPFLTAEVDTLALVTGRGATTATESTFSGGILMADSDLNRPVLEDFGVKHQSPTVSTNTVTVDLTLGNSAYIDMDPATAAVALTLSNPPASGTYGEVSLLIQMGTPAHTITWPGSVTWQGGGSAPTLTTINNDVDLVHLFTVDAGTTWYGTYSLSVGSAGEANQTITTGLGLDGADAGDSGNITIDLALTELSVVTAAAADWIAIEDATDNSTKKALISDTDVGFFNNATTEYVSENDSLVVVDWNWVLDEDAMGTDSATHVPTQQSVKAYVDTEVAAAVASEMTYKGGYNAATNTPALDTGSPTLAVGDMYYVTVAGTFFALPVVAGDVLIANTASTDAALFADWDVIEGLQSIPDASETEKGIIEIATQAEVDAETSGLLAVTPLYLHETVFDGGTF